MQNKSTITFLLVLGTGAFNLAREALVPDLTPGQGQFLAVVSVLAFLGALFLWLKTTYGFWSKYLAWVKFIRFQWPWPFYRTDKPFTRGVPLEQLLYLANLSVEPKDLEKEGTFKFFLRGYNATPHTLEFRCRGGNILLGKDKENLTKLPTPSLGFPWPHPVEPYSEFGIHVIQTIPKKLKQEVETALKDNNPLRFTFSDLEVFADTVGKQRLEISLGFRRWACIDVERKQPILGVSNVIHMPISVGIKVTPTIGKG